MEHLKNIFGSLLAIFGSVLSYILSWGTPIEIMMIILLINGGLYLLDPLTKCGNIKEMIILPRRAAVIILVIYIAWILSRDIDNGAVYCAVCWYYIGIEGLSAINHAHNIGLPIPARLRAIIAQMEEE